MTRLFCCVTSTISCGLVTVCTSSSRRSMDDLHAVHLQARGPLPRPSGIVDHQLEHESVELGLGQVVGPFRLDRVLSGHGPGNGRSILWPTPSTVTRYSCMISNNAAWVLGGRAVDFVRQQELGEHGTRPETELLGLHVEDRRAGDVRGHQVGRELDPAEAAARGRGPRFVRRAFCRGPARFRSARGHWRTGRRACRARVRPGRRRSCGSRP